ncbi:MAG: ester cyclase [Chromatiales bacterium]|nr:ester cyclase [Chromatiales bacterium]
MTKSNEERVRFANDELFEKGNLGVVDEIFSADYIVHSGGKDYKGREFIKRFIKLLRLAISDIRVVEIKFLSQTGDIIVWQRTLSGVHQADMMGIPPTGEKVEWREMVVTRFDGEKIAEEWTVSELAGQLLLKLPGAC